MSFKFSSYLLCLGAFFLNLPLSHGQLSKDVSILVNPVVIAHTGRSYGLNVQYGLNKWRLYAGFKYHQNLSEEPKYNNRKLRYRFYGASPLQNVGYNIGVNYKIRWRYSSIKPYVYYDLTYFRMDTRSLLLTKVDSIPNTILITPIRYYNLSSLENNLGIGFNGYVSESLSINMRGGLGVNYISNLPTTEYINGRHFGLSMQLAAGIQYDFK